MGHKVNPDIFRLGVTKTWSFQLKTNKNFLRNLFLFKYLKNLFTQYSVPFFNFNNLRNKKFNDKLIFKGEDQLILSPFVKSNILFSHVYFGQFNNHLTIESYFIDVNIKQKRRNKHSRRRSEILTLRNYNRTEPAFIKLSIIKRYRKSKGTQTILRSWFMNRRYRWLSKKFDRKFKLYRKKSFRKISRQFFYFNNNLAPKYHRKLKYYFRVKKNFIPYFVLKKEFKREYYKIRGNLAKQQLSKEKELIIAKKARKYLRILDSKLTKKQKLKQIVFLKLETKKLKKQKLAIRRRLNKLKNIDIRLLYSKKKKNSFKMKIKKLQLNSKFKLLEKRKELYIKLNRDALRFYKLFFIKRIFEKRKKKLLNQRPNRFKRKIKFTSLNPYLKHQNYKHKSNYFRKIVLPKIKKLVPKTPVSAQKALFQKRGLPKMPLQYFNFVEKKGFVFFKAYKNLKLLKYFIRLIKYLRFFGTKKKIFFCHNLICLLINFMGLVNRSVMTKKLMVFLQCLIHYSYSYSFYNFLNFKHRFFSKYIFFKGVSKTIFRSVLELTKATKLTFNVTGQNKFRFNSSLVLNYILIKLGQYFNINEIVNPLSYFIKYLTTIAGYKILITGRLTRKERAAVMIRSGRRMPLSTISAPIDYSAGFKIMKFGMVGIKVYLLLKPSTLLNLYKFKYIYAKTT